jgi:hypothetical protein
MPPNFRTTGTKLSRTARGASPLSEEQDEHAAAIRMQRGYQRSVKGPCKRVEQRSLLNTVR